MKDICLIIVAFFIILFSFMVIFRIMYPIFLKIISKSIDIMRNYTFVINKKEEKLSAGYIINKEMLNGKLLYFTYIPTRYRFYIICENIEVNGKIYKCERQAYFDVSEKLYGMYSIGDWFDSQNPWKFEAMEEKKE